MILLRTYIVAIMFLRIAKTIDVAPHQIAVRTETRHKPQNRRPIFHRTGHQEMAPVTFHDRRGETDETSLLKGFSYKRHPTQRHPQASLGCEQRNIVIYEEAFTSGRSIWNASECQPATPISRIGVMEQRFLGQKAR